MSAIFAESGTYFVQNQEHILFSCVILITSRNICDIFFHVIKPFFFSSMIEDIYCEDVIIHKAEV